MYAAIPPKHGKGSIRDIAPLLATSGIYYLVGAWVVIAGIASAFKFAELCREDAKSATGSVIGSMGNWDGKWYAEIARRGYSFDRGRESSVAFFPAFPIVARGVAAVTRLRAELALLVTANMFLFGSLALLVAYLRERLPDIEQRAIDDILLATTVFPTSFYFRMAYSEAMFLFLSLLAFYAMERQWRPIYIALVIGLATATRSVGVALLLPLALDVWQRSTTWPRVLSQAFVLLPVGCWGLLLYISYQAWAFGEPFAFIQTQTHWSGTLGHHSWLERGVRLVTLKPLWSVYDPASSCYWAHRPPHDSAWLSMMFANPIWFLFAAGSVVLGACKRWLNAKEVAFGAMLLLITYVLQGDRMCMASQARFASVVFPMYVVCGQVLQRLARPIAAAVLIASGTLLGIYAAMFASWYAYY